MILHWMSFEVLNFELILTWVPSKWPTSLLSSPNFIMIQLKVNLDESKPIKQMITQKYYSLHKFHRFIFFFYLFLFFIGIGLVSRWREKFNWIELELTLPWYHPGNSIHMIVKFNANELIVWRKPLSCINIFNNNNMNN